MGVFCDQRLSRARIIMVGSARKQRFVILNIIFNVVGQTGGKCWTCAPVIASPRIHDQQSLPWKGRHHYGHLAAGNSEPAALSLGLAKTGTSALHWDACQIPLGFQCLAAPQLPTALSNLSVPCLLVGHWMSHHDAIWQGSCLSEKTHRMNNYWQADVASTTHLPENLYFGALWHSVYHFCFVISVQISIFPQHALQSTMQMNFVGFSAITQSHSFHIVESSVQRSS